MLTNTNTPAPTVECYRRRERMTAQACIGHQLREYDTTPGLCAKCSVGRRIGEQTGIEIPIVSIHAHAQTN